MVVSPHPPPPTLYHGPLLTYYFDVCKFIILNHVLPPSSFPFSGLIIACVSYILAGLPMTGFPRSLPKKYDEAHDDFMGHSKRERSNESGSVEETMKPKSKKKAAFKSIKGKS